MKHFIIFTILATLPISQPSRTKFENIFTDKGMKLNSLLQLAKLQRISHKATIDHSLMERLLFGHKENVIVEFTQGNQPVIDHINNMGFSSISEKRFALTGAQKAFASESQSSLQNFLRNLKVRFETFWISNMMSVQNVDAGLAEKMADVPGVAHIDKEPQFRIDPPMPSNGSQSRANIDEFPWGIQKIRANQVWERYTGKEVVVCNIDTGVRYTHEALAGRWRTDYGWFDPYKGTSTPNDQNGHGTHTMGTMAGKGIGVAPDATWIACKGCNTNSCGNTQLMRCCEWVQCPSKTDGTASNCSMAPKVVSNSWGGGQGGTFYDKVINSWRSAGIIPVMSIGNAGQNGCGSANTPGDNAQVIGVGSTDENEQISYFSSMGPTVKGKMKPDICAPGGQIRSAWFSNDTAYNTISGTSMACPHVSGVMALMLQKKPTLTYDEAYKAMTGTAVTSFSNTTTISANNCGGIESNKFPNHVFGFGRIDALNCINAIQ